MTRLLSTFTASLTSWIGICWLLLCGNQLSAQQAYKPLEKSLLWEVSGNGLSKPSYLFGTIHIIDSDKYFWTPAMDKAFGEADQIVFEIDMKDMQDMGKMMGMMQLLFMQDGKTLSDLLSEEDYALVEARFTELGLPLNLFGRMKPFFLSTLISEDMGSTALQDGRIRSYEMELMQLANERSKPVTGLETIEFQASIFDSIPYEVQAEMLVTAIRESKDGGQQEQMLNDMVTLYTAQDLEGLYKMIQSQMTEDMPFQEVLLEQRNRNWIPILEKMMRENAVFAAVGAGHMAGEQGVIHLLRKQGYKVKPIYEKI